MEQTKRRHQHELRAEKLIGAAREQYCTGGHAAAEQARLLRRQGVAAEPDDVSDVDDGVLGEAGDGQEVVDGLAGGGEREARRAVPRHMPGRYGSAEQRLLRGERQSAHSPHCARNTGTTVSPTATSCTCSPTLSTTLE